VTVQVRVAVTPGQIYVVADAKLLDRNNIDMTKPTFKNNLEANFMYDLMIAFKEIKRCAVVNRIMRDRFQ